MPISSTNPNGPHAQQRLVDALNNAATANAQDGASPEPSPDPNDYPTPTEPTPLERARTEAIRHNHASMSTGGRRPPSIPSASITVSSDESSSDSSLPHIEIDLTPPERSRVVRSSGQPLTPWTPLTLQAPTTVSSGGSNTSSRSAPTIFIPDSPAKPLPSLGDGIGELLRPPVPKGDFPLPFDTFERHIRTEERTKELIRSVQTRPKEMADRINLIKNNLVTAERLRAEADILTISARNWYAHLNTEQFREATAKFFNQPPPPDHRGSTAIWLPYFPIGARERPIAVEKKTVRFNPLPPKPPSPQRPTPGPSTRHPTPGPSTRRPAPAPSGKGKQAAKFYCYNCGDPSHLKAYCPHYYCRVCGKNKPGHYPSECPKRYDDDPPEDDRHPDDYNYLDDYIPEAESNMSGEPHY